MYNGLVASDYFVESDSYVKLRELSVAYTLGARALQFAGINRVASGVKLALIGRNLYTWTKYTGWDPETNAGAQRTLVRGFSFATTPIPRSVGISITANY